MTSLDRIIQDVRKSMDSHGWDQKKLAQEAGLSEGTISRLLHPPHYVTMYTLCIVCDTLDLKLACLPKEEQ